MNTLKEQIKELSEGQFELKNQRKTVKLIGERKIPTWEATSKHFYNRIKLREMYVAYGILKGLTIEQIEGSSKTSVDMNAVNKLIEQYGKVIHTS